MPDTGLVLVLVHEVSGRYCAYDHFGGSPLLINSRFDKIRYMHPLRIRVFNNRALILVLALLSTTSPALAETSAL